MDHKDRQSPGRPHIRGGLLPTTYEGCGAPGTAFQASTTPGPAATFTKRQEVSA
jgi:hypothetical protein